MENLIINQVPLDISDDKIKIYYALSNNKEQYGYGVFTKEISKLLPESYYPKISTESALGKALNSEKANFQYFHFTFVAENQDTGWQTCEIDLSQDTYFRSFYLQEYLYNFFQNSSFLLEKDFIGNLQVWDEVAQDQQTTHYQVINLKIDRNKSGEYLTIGIDSQCSYIHKKTIEELGINHTLVKRVLNGKFVKRINRLEEDEIKKGKPVIKPELVSEFQGLQHLDFRPTFSFKNHLNIIESFYSKYLKGQELVGNVKVLTSGLRKLTDSETYHIKRENNILEFGKGGLEFDAYRGFSNYGSYKLPEGNLNTKFIFIFHESDKELANSLYKYMRYGHRHFPGLESFTGLKFDLDKGNSIIFKDRTNPMPEVINKLQQGNLQTGIVYIAFYISPFSEETASVEEEKIYYRMKEELLKVNVTSQVIEAEKLKSQNVHFYLPNIAIAVVAKLGGIPWKLKREVENFLLLGFGDRTIKGDPTHFIGNTVCFNNEGEFKNLQCFNYTEENLKNSLESAIKNHLENNENPSKLVIHYFKDWGSKEDNKLLSVFKKLNIEIPYVVLNINDNKARDYICFDNNYQAQIPLSGTFVQLRKKEYLLFNNDRYSNDMSTYKGKDRHPIKIKISMAKNVDIEDTKEILNLIDQVYQFSRLYWRSIKQKSLPVTTYYAKRLAKMVSCFESKQLPNTNVATKTLWFI